MKHARADYQDRIADELTEARAMIARLESEAHHWNLHSIAVTDRAEVAEAKAERAEAEVKRLREALQAADSVIIEEINPSNYDHETVCRISSMWDEATGIMAEAIEAALKEQQG